MAILKLAKETLNNPPVSATKLKQASACFRQLIFLTNSPLKNQRKPVIQRLPNNGTQKISYGIGMVLLLWAGMVQAGPCEQVLQFTHTVDRASFQFEQKTKKLKRSGVLAFERPHRVVLRYQKPYVETLLIDKGTLKHHDPELKQVIERQAIAAAGLTPMAILAGDKNLEASFELKNTAKNTCYMVPKKQELFRSIELTMDKLVPSKMMVEDWAQKTTEFVLSQAQFPNALPAGLFVLSYGADTDVIKQ